MATGYIILPAAAAVLPDGSTSNLAARMQRVKGTGTAPVPHWLELAFPDASTTGAMWTWELPPDSNATVAITARIFWKANAITNAVRWSGQLSAWLGSATTALPAHNYATAQLVTASTGTTTARQLNVTSLSITNLDSIAPGTICSFMLQRIGADAADTLTVDAEVMMLEMAYSI